MVGALEEEELMGLNVQQLEYRSESTASLVLSQLSSLLYEHLVPIFTLAQASHDSQ